MVEFLQADDICTRGCKLVDDEGHPVFPLQELWILHLEIDNSGLRYHARERVVSNEHYARGGEGSFRMSAGTWKPPVCDRPSARTFHWSTERVFAPLFLFSAETIVFLGIRAAAASARATPARDFPPCLRGFRNATKALRARNRGDARPRAAQVSIVRTWRSMGCQNDPPCNVLYPCGT